MNRYPVDLDTVAVWRSSARILSNEELHAWRNDLKWCITDAEVDDECEPHLNENSIINSVAAIAAIDAEFRRRERYGISKPISSLGWPREWLDELKRRVRVEDLIQQHVVLNRRGAALAGLCPFHNDRNPSLIVWPDSQRWRCFGCGIHGDAIAWEQAISRLEFREAVGYLAAITDLALPDLSSRTPQPAANERMWV